MDKLKKKAFVLMPFQDPFNSYYPAVFKPALEDAGYEVTRADDLFNPRPIILDIQQSIIGAQLILCDMSGKNPNVFYELGLAHAIGRPVILVSRKEDDIPFDLRHVRVILYDYAAAGWENKLRSAITTAAKSVEHDEIWPPSIIKSTSVSPVKTSITDSAIYLLERVQDFDNYIQQVPDSDKILALGIESFLIQNDELPRKFKETFAHLGLPYSEINEIKNLIDLDDMLFVNHKIPFSEIDEVKGLWFVTDGLKAEKHTRVRDYQPPRIYSGSKTKLDDWSFALYNKAIGESPDKPFNEYVSELIDVWQENRVKYNEFIQFWNSVDFHNKYMNLEQFLSQRSDVAIKFQELYDEIRTYLDLEKYGFKNPYFARDWIKELKIVLKRVTRQS